MKYKRPQNSQKWSKRYILGKKKRPQKGVFNPKELSQVFKYYLTSLQDQAESCESQILIPTTSSTAEEVEATSRLGVEAQAVIIKKESKVKASFIKVPP